MASLQVDSPGLPPGRGHGLTLGSRAWLLLPVTLLAGVGLIVIAGLLTLETTYSNRVAGRVRTLDVDLGGRTREEARGLLNAEVATRLRQPVELRASDEVWETTARDLGMALDVDSLVSDAYGIGRDGDPLQRAAAPWMALLWRDWQVSRGPNFDRALLRERLEAYAADFDQTANDAQLNVDAQRDGQPTVVTTPEQAGRRLLVEPSLARVVEALVGGGTEPIDLVVEETAPATYAADLVAARAEAEQILSAPLVLDYGLRSWTIDTRALASALSIELAPGEGATVRFDPTALRPRFDDIARQVYQSPVNARFALNGSSISVLRDSEDGRALDPSALEAVVGEVVLTDTRRVSLPTVVERPAVASSDALRMSFGELVKEGRTSFAGSGNEKLHNVRLAASRLNGVVVPSGATFSFNREVGPTTIEAGFQSAWGITASANGHQTVPSVAGGICQVATTLFQPVFHAGYPIEERNYHLYWIPSYGQAPLGMKGLDATVDEEYGLDLKFVNSTPDPLLIQSHIDGTSIVFGLYGTRPDWTVQVSGPVIANQIAANTELVRRPERTLDVGRQVTVESAQDGFEATVTRTVTQGDDVRTLALKSRYAPAQNVVLYGTRPAAAPTATPRPEP